ncbi:MAG: lysine--tRNA ligase [Candidatus Kerfeldbacteria bacterium CG_4_10_14_0_8_um_filter_42_10]|uniref:Lysine--tRNA ligase n=1 Tax=Candidatus Kerfeldbacteria bacterium CG_4_10_14_0_8_um_filter_42_10 TaxID=2014248 RepID=A0A2M7RKE7_9BACT|nr:MAG: lysine--tRNA ligase [Candidatus Kerfeldbacteria bacterium CG_4_10_14_0_8_um_filter_42_10]
MEKENFSGYLKEEAIRQKKVQRLRALGIDPFPAKLKKEKSIEKILADFNDLEKKGSTVILNGRVRSIRRHGGSTFAHIQDTSGLIQIYFKKDVIGEKLYQELSDNVDPADFIQTEGTLFTTHKGEKTVLAKNYVLAVKAALPLPEKWHGLVDTEIRYRKRYLDLLANQEVVNIFKKRAKIIKTIRDFLNQNGFLEVETPILQLIPGGAAARPFVTHHNALNEDFYLRVAPELYLKKLVVGGLERVFEIARCFRNEGIDWSHNPEFTMLEFYAAYWDYHDLMEFTEKLFAEIMNKTAGGFSVEYKGNKIDFTPPYPRLKFKTAILKEAGIDIDKIRSQEDLVKTAKAKGLKPEKSWGAGKILDELYKDFVRPKLIQPTFLIDYPLELSPLAKKIKSNPKYVERFQLIAAGFELNNCFSELNDPDDQLERFKEQEKLRQGGDEEAQRFDQDFIEALKHGLPPTAGFGMGLDRLVALVCNAANLKEVILFPTLRPEKHE